MQKARQRRRQQSLARHRYLPQLALLLGSGIVALGAASCVRSAQEPSESPGPGLVTQSDHSVSAAGSEPANANRRGPPAGRVTQLDMKATRRTPQSGSNEASRARPVLPERIVPGKLSRVSVSNYRPAYVVHGAPGITRAMVYLHGVCGDVKKVRAWSEQVSRFATVVGLLGDKPCKGSFRYRWSQDRQLIHVLAQRALRAVKVARAGQLDIDRAILFGYSQGASRAEALAARYPKQYPWVILGGSPRSPDPTHFSIGQAVAVLAGEKEATAHLERGTIALREAGIRARFALFPSSGHGEFGPQAAEVMIATLDWLRPE